ncbi:helix-turn-helix transcriptional regulator [Paenibacillus sp. 11B]|uniref:helix-turn-helix domain-containing protein n=1 Tax=Paenibacillus sp. 11B TaxID=3060965 RepID=UPI00264B670F|nr:helix-turn-helix transcriptional regulator [Paenibacillus sp. 11B]MDN8588775.1 helix-turn-helix transcriptional regulator [Paenibacillus sp. 11B]
MSIAETVSKLMESEGLSKYKLAKESGVPYTTLIKILDGTTKNPQIESLQSIAKYFNVDVDDLIDSGSSNEAKVEKPELPNWATKKDIADFKQMLEEDQPVMFDGVPIEGEKRQRVMDILSGLFWEAKELNKQTYGTKKKAKEEEKNSQE